MKLRIAGKQSTSLAIEASNALSNTETACHGIISRKANNSRTTKHLAVTLAAVDVQKCSMDTARLVLGRGRHQRDNAMASGMPAQHMMKIECADI